MSVSKGKKRPKKQEAGYKRDLLHIDAEEILKFYERVACASISDYLKVTTDQTGNTEIRFCTDEQTDWSVVEEVGLGTGKVPRIKLYDKIKALEKLERYFDMFPDMWKRKLEQQKLDLAQAQAQAQHSQVLFEVITNVPRPTEDVYERKEPDINCLLSDEQAGTVSSERGGRGALWRCGRRG